MLKNAYKPSTVETPKAEIKPALKPSFRVLLMQRIASGPIDMASIKPMVIALKKYIIIII